ncbi:hypothetical protein GCM10027597_64700 [Saccharopolyspora tripterygii]
MIEGVAGVGLGCPRLRGPSRRTLLSEPGVRLCGSSWGMSMFVMGAVRSGTPAPDLPTPADEAGLAVVEVPTVEWVDPARDPGSHRPSAQNVTSNRRSAPRSAGTAAATRPHTSEVHDNP